MDKSQVDRQQRRVVFSGHVQGVGFRYQARDIAGRYPVTGYVQNLPDGTVLLVIEGEDLPLEKTIDDICKTMARNIRSHCITAGLASNEFQEFSIRY